MEPPRRPDIAHHRHKLAAGSLPHNSIPRFWGGPPNGEDCDACDEVTKAKMRPAVAAAPAAALPYPLIPKS